MSINMNEDECLNRFGLTPSENELPSIRNILNNEVQKELESQGNGDTELIKLCCVQLFSAGQLDDILIIWKAKKSSMDAGFAVDVQFLCGAGLVRTKQFLQIHHSDEAFAALDYIKKCESSNDFEDFSPTEYLKHYLSYYGSL